MPLYAGELNIRRGAPLAEYPAPLSEVLDAQAEDTRVHNPFNALRRMNALQEAEQGRYIGTEVNQHGAVVPKFEPPRRLDAETARARVKEEGVSLTIPDDGIAEPALDILVNAKRREMQRQNIFSRGPDGIGAGAARLGTALLNSLYDPLNIASAFVPIMGPARYAAMVARAGSPLARAGVRASVGAAEGAVGAAILEPLIYGAAQSEQLDYTMADSLANVAFGGLFGGGLHVGVGGVRDLVQPGWWKEGTGADIDIQRRDHDTATGRNAAEVAARDATPQSRETMLRAAVVQAAEGRAVDVDAILRGERDAIGAAYDRVRGNPAGAADDPTVRLQPRDIGEVLMERGPGIIDDKNGQITVRPGGYGLLKIIWKHGDPSTTKPEFRVTRDDVLNTADVMHDFKPVIDTTQADGKRLIEWHVPRADGKTVVYGVRGFSGDDTKHVVTIFVNEGRSKRMRELPLSERKAAVEPDSPAGSFQGFRRDTGPAAFSIGPQDGQGNGTVARLAESRAAAQKSAQPDAIRSADPEASAAADRTIREAKSGNADLAAAEAHLTQALDDTDALVQALGGGDALKVGMIEYDQAIARTEQYAKALKAGAACGIA